MATVISPQQSIPGPRALPFLSWRANMVSFYRNPFSYMLHLHQRYGNLVTVAYGDPSYVFAFGPDLNFQILSHPDLFEVSAALIGKLSPDTALGRLFFNNLPLLTGAQHRKQRRLMQPSFHKKQIAQYQNDMVTLTQRLLDDWQPSSRIDVLSAMKQLTQRIAVKTLFGLYDEAELERAGAILRPLATLSPLALVLRINIPGFPYHRMLSLAEQMETFTHSMIEQKRAQPDATDILAVLSRAHDEDGTTMSEEELIGNAFTLFVAGHETTSNALTWAIFLLSQHPHSFANVLDELDVVLHGGPPTLEHLRQLPLLEGVVKETLRLLPPASIGIRAATAPCELNGFSLPAGSNILFSQFVTHRLPELYEEPDRFKPERWITLHRTPYEYLPFSAGQHRCIGAEFAMQEMMVVLALLLPRYRLAAIPNTPLNVHLLGGPRPGMPMHVFPQDRQFRRIPVRGTIHQLIDMA